MKRTHTSKPALIVAISMAVGTGLSMNQLANEPKPGRRITEAEYKDLRQKDPVLQFVDRVNDRALKDPTWSKDYALALYRAFGAETRKHLIDLGIESISVENP